MGAGPARSRNSMEARTANAKWARDRKIGDLVKRALEAIIGTWP